MVTDIKIVKTDKGYDLYLDGRLTHSGLSKRGLLEIISHMVDN